MSRHHNKVSNLLLPVRRQRRPTSQPNQQSNRLVLRPLPLFLNQSLRLQRDKQKSPNALKLSDLRPVHRTFVGCLTGQFAMGMEDYHPDLNGNDILAAMMGNMITIAMVYSREIYRQDCLQTSPSVGLRIATVDFPGNPNGQTDLDGCALHMIALMDGPMGRVYPMRRQVVRDQAHRRTLTVLD
jgi:hypothetical protein